MCMSFAYLMQEPHCSYEAFHIHNLFIGMCSTHCERFLFAYILDDIGQYAVHGFRSNVSGVYGGQITGCTDFKAVSAKSAQQYKIRSCLVADLTQTACYINAERRVHQNIQQNNIKPSAV